MHLLGASQLVKPSLKHNMHCPSTDITGVRVMVFNSTFNNISVISWQSVLLVVIN
jgi:hypothetical protein